MKLSERLSKLATANPYDPTRVRAIQAALDEAEGQPYDSYIPELWERFAEVPLTDLHVSFQPEPYVALPLVEALRQDRCAKPLLNILAVNPRTLSTTLQLILEMENREYTLDMQPNRVRSGLPTRMRVGEFDENKRATLGLYFMLERAVATYEEASLSPLPLKARSDFFEAIKDVVVESDALKTPRVREMIENVGFQSMRDALRSAFQMLQGKSLSELGCKNPYEPELALSALGLQGEINGNYVFLELPKLVRWRLP